MYLVGGRLGGGHWPGGINGLDLLVQLVELDVSEHMVPLPPGQPQLVQQTSHLSGFQLRICQRLKIILVLTWCHNYRKITGVNNNVSYLKLT